jgi:hypothetical protein
LAFPTSFSTLSHIKKDYSHMNKVYNSQSNKKLFTFAPSLPRTHFREPPHTMFVFERPKYKNKETNDQQPKIENRKTTK